ncbi:Unannotated [Lentimonas sp. CC19]|nr:Unannotated [Lentimonas sp. CC10]CAA6697333.1 Unannotated [Lentimonas sp. CC19]CAA7072254.1 Unannotated [Lentimonas sp. CC11]
MGSHAKYKDPLFGLIFVCFGSVDRQECLYHVLLLLRNRLQFQRHEFDGAVGFGICDREAEAINS